MGIALFAAAIAAASVPAPPTPAQLPDADPAIWVVNDSDTVIFLFGTFHALDGKSDWFNDEVKTAFASSEELVLETVIPDHSKAAPKDPQSLTIAPSASFLASTRMAISAGRSRGMQVSNGADMVLKQAAQSAGKNVAGLERFEEQLSMFARVPGSGPKRSAVEDARARQVLANVMSQMQAAWNRGDQGILAAMLNQMRTVSPDTYKVMFTDRNSNWAQWITQRLEKPGTVFVAVGAGHLVGHDNVQAKLAALGVRSARIN